MNTVDQLRNDIRALSAFSTLREREYTRRRDEIAQALRIKRKELERVRAEMLAKAGPPLFKELGFAVSIWRVVTRRALERLLSVQRATENDVQRMVRDGRSSEQGRKTMSAVTTRLSKTEAEIKDLDHPPEEIAARLSVIAQTVALVGKKKEPKRIVEAARAVIVCVDAWSKAGQLSRSSSGDEKEGRIWLPIPSSMSAQATALGAKREPAFNGASGFYVGVGEPLARYNSLLPLAFRETRPKLKFAQIRANAHRQNIWSFMDTLSWDHIRNVNYSMTGRRCILCGKQSGKKLLRQLEPDKLNKVGSVECHEVWNWTRPDPDLPVGIQSLERIMVVCHDCHMCFHDDIAKAKAFAVGGDDLVKQVQTYLMTRRAGLTHMDIKEVALEMRAENASLGDHKGVTNWIVDLSKLAKQDYMYGQTPTLMTNNPAGVKASQIAGITFRDQDGIVHPAVSPERLYQDVAMKWITQPEPTYKVVGQR